MGWGGDVVNFDHAAWTLHKMLLVRWGGDVNVPLAMLRSNWVGWCGGDAASVRWGGMGR